MLHTIIHILLYIGPAPPQFESHLSVIRGCIYRIKFNFQPDFNSFTLVSTGSKNLVPYKFPSVFVCCRLSARLLKEKLKIRKTKSRIETNSNWNTRTRRRRARVAAEAKKNFIKTTNFFVQYYSILLGAAKQANEKFFEKFLVINTKSYK